MKPDRVRVPRGPSKLEEEVWRQFLALGLRPEREYLFHPTRRWRFDFAFPDRAVAVEVQGGIYGAARSGHSTGRGIERDCEKLCYAALAGWRVFPLTERAIKSGSGILLVLKALDTKEIKP